MLCCFSGTNYDVITFLINIIQKREYLQNEKRYAKKENAILYSEKPFKQAAIMFYFIGTLSTALFSIYKLPFQHVIKPHFANSLCDHGS